jgi:hypothetical protein
MAPKKARVVASHKKCIGFKIGFAQTDGKLIYKVGFLVLKIIVHEKHCW